MIMTNPHSGMRIIKNVKLRMLNSQPAQPQSGRCNRMEPGDRMRILPVIADTTSIIRPRLKLNAVDISSPPLSRTGKGKKYAGAGGK